MRGACALAAVNNDNKPFQLFISFTDEAGFMSGVSESDVLVDGRALDRADGVAVGTPVRMIVEM